MVIRPRLNNYLAIGIGFLALLVMDVILFLGQAMVLAIIFTGIYLCAFILYIHTNCRTLEFLPDGCLIHILFSKKFYTWDEIVVKRLECCENTIGFTHLTYEEGILFAIRSIRRPAQMKLADFCLFLHPFCSFFVTFPSTKIGNTPRYYPAPYSIDKNQIMQKFCQWGVHIENA